MGSKMVERVAFALEQAGIDFDGCAVIDPAFPRDPSPRDMALARAAIEAMREPSDTMMLAATRAGYVEDASNARWTFSAMIDVALGEH